MQRKKIALITAFVTTVVILGLSAWLVQLNGRISESLKNKKFLPPTEYFSAPEYIRARMNVTSADFKSHLAQRKYLAKSLNERLHPGEYAEGTAEACAQLLTGTFPTEGKSCILFLLKENEDPELKNFGLQLLVFNGEDKTTSGVSRQSLDRR